MTMVIVLNASKVIPLCNISLFWSCIFLHLDESDPFNISVSWICFVERFITSLLSCIRVPLSPSFLQTMNWYVNLAWLAHEEAEIQRGSCWFALILGLFLQWKTCISHRQHTLKQFSQLPFGNGCPEECLHLIFVTSYYVWHLALDLVPNGCHYFMEQSVMNCG